MTPINNSPVLLCRAAVLRIFFLSFIVQDIPNTRHSEFQTPLGSVHLPYRNNFDKTAAGESFITTDRGPHRFIIFPSDIPRRLQHRKYVRNENLFLPLFVFSSSLVCAYDNILLTFFFIHAFYSYFRLPLRTHITRNGHARSAERVSTSGNVLLLLSSNIPYVRNISTRFFFRYK